MRRYLGLGYGTYLAVIVMAAAPQPAQARDFFSALFGGFMQQRSAAPVLPFAAEGGVMEPGRAAIPGGGGQAYCVRTCDGRYFPIGANDRQSRAETCQSFCPATETKVFRGSSIDTASSDNGKPYSQLPNAFRYRNELVAGCSCNGKDPGGLAKIKVEDDPTLRKGDIVAGANGLVVSGKVDSRRAMNFSPAPRSVRARFERIPVVASE